MSGVSRKNRSSEESLTRRSVVVDERYDALLRRLQADPGGTGEVPRAIGVTSCGQREGVTTVVVNLAIAAAAASRGPILLVDANVIRPFAHKALKVQSQTGEGLVEVTRGRASVFDCIVESDIDNLSLLPSGQATNDREPFYEATSIEDLLDSIKHVFPLVFFDLPPATDATACFAFAGRLDGVVLVIEEDRIERRVAERAKARLLETNAKILGVVVNKHR